MWKNQLPVRPIALDPLLIHRLIFELYNKSIQCLYQECSNVRARLSISNS